MCAMVAAVNNISLYLRRGIQSHVADEDPTTPVVGLGMMSNEKQHMDWRQHQQPHHANTTTPV